MTAALVCDSPIPRPIEAAIAPLGELVREHTPYVWRVLRSLGVHETDLEDVCQETFIVVHRRLHTFEGRASLRSWIYGIALRVVSDYRGKAHRRREILTPEPPESMHVAPQEAALERKRAWELIDRLLERLSDEQRQVFVLYEVEQLSMREVSEIIGCPLQTAYSRLHAARKLVQEQLGRVRGAGGTR
jgi:RNA polymerase sigma-70 factor (ECF subfamily)